MNDHLIWRKAARFFVTAQKPVRKPRHRRAASESKRTPKSALRMAWYLAKKSDVGRIH